MAKTPSSPPPQASHRLPSPPVSTPPKTSSPADPPTPSSPDHLDLPKHLEVAVRRLSDSYEPQCVSLAQWMQIKPNLADVRCEYDPNTQLATRRMTTAVHDRVAVAIRDSLAAHFRRLQKDDSGLSRDLRVAVAGLTDGAHTRVIIPTSRGEWQTDPDVQWKAQELDDLPSFVAEVARTETEAHLIQKCQNYIRKSKGDIRATLAVMVPCGKKVLGKCWLFRPTLKMLPNGVQKASVEEVNSAVFLDGEDKKRGHFDILLSDLLPYEPGTDLQREAMNTILELSFAELQSAVEAGQHIDNAQQARKSGQATRKRGAAHFHNAVWSDDGTESEFEPNEEGIEEPERPTTREVKRAKNA